MGFRCFRGILEVWRAFFGWREAFCKGIDREGAFCEGVRGEMRVRWRTVYERRQSGGSANVWRKGWQVL